MALRGKAGRVAALVCVLALASHCFTTAQEKEAGAQASAKIEATMGLVDDPALLAYVRRVGDRLAKHAERQDIEYRFFIVDAPEPNAFALPGGYVYISRGLLAITNSEDELANVVGHEIGHVAARHHAKGAQRSAIFLPVQIVAGIGAAATSIVSPTLGKVVGGVASLPTAITLSAYNRDQEREADELGQRYAAEEGWDPAGMATLMDTLGREQALIGGGAPIPWLSSHPSSPERSRDAKARVSSLERGKPNPIAGTRGAFVRRLDGLVVGPSAAEGVFVETRFLHPVLDFTMLFPEGWETQNGRHMIAARSPSKESFVLVNLADAENLEEAADKFRKAHGRFDVGPNEVQVAGRPALRAESTSGSFLDRQRLHLTWLTHGKHIFQVAGLAPEATFESQREVFEATDASFRTLRRADRREITESRLRVVTAPGGKTVAQVAEKKKSAWSGEEAAVANGMQVSSELPSGAPLKLVFKETYAR